MHFTLSHATDVTSKSRTYSTARACARSHHGMMPEPALDRGEGLCRKPLFLIASSAVGCTHAPPRTVD